MCVLRMGEIGVNKMTNKSPLDRVKDAKNVFDLLSKSDKEKCRNDIILYGQYFVKTERAPNVMFAVSRVAPEDVVINDVHSEDEPTSFDMLQEFMEGK